MSLTGACNKIAISIRTKELTPQIIFASTVMRIMKPPLQGSQEPGDKERVEGMVVNLPKKVDR